MRSRIDELMGQSMGGMWVGTFHGLAHRLLRMHWQEAGLPEDFHILDSDDQLRLIKRLIRSLKIDDDRWPAKQCQWYINAQKAKAYVRGISNILMMTTPRPCWRSTQHTKSNASAGA